MNVYGEDDISRFNINVTEMEDSAVIYPAESQFKKLAEMERLPILLSKTLFHWMSKNPQFRVRNTLPIVEDGYTVAIHVWFDRPDSSW